MLKASKTLYDCVDASLAALLPKNEEAAGNLNVIVHI